MHVLRSSRCRMHVLRSSRCHMHVLCLQSWLQGEICCCTDSGHVHSVMIHAWVPVPCIHVPVRAYLQTLDHASRVSC